MKHVKPRKENNLRKQLFMLVPMSYRATKTQDEIANEIVELANSIKTSKNDVVASNIVLRKDRFNNKAKEVMKI